MQKHYTEKDVEQNTKEFDDSSTYSEKAKYVEGLKGGNLPPNLKNVVKEVYNTEDINKVLKTTEEEIKKSETEFLSLSVQRHKVLSEEQIGNGVKDGEEAVIANITKNNDHELEVNLEIMANLKLENDKTGILTVKTQGGGSNRYSFNASKSFDKLGGPQNGTIAKIVFNEVDGGKTTKKTVYESTEHHYKTPSRP